MDEREFAVVVDGVAAGLDRIRNLGVLGYLHTEAAEGIGHLSKIRVFELGTGDTSRIVAFLVSPNRPVFLVVHHNNERSSTVLGRGRNFLAVHQELTITCNRNYATLREVQRGGHR